MPLWAAPGAGSQQAGAGRDGGRLPEKAALRPSRRAFPETAQKNAPLKGRIGFLHGGAEGNRTLDLMNAIHALSQLSYGPTKAFLG